MKLSRTLSMSAVGFLAGGVMAYVMLKTGLPFFVALVIVLLLLLLIAACRKE